MTTNKNYKLVLTPLELEDARRILKILKEQKDELKIPAPYIMLAV